jgi:hypothetical protein
MKRRALGLTLTEAIIATTLALLLGLLMVKMISSGLDAHKKGTQSRDAESGVRSLVGMFVAELRSASVPPLSEPMVVTPVFWPGAWGAEQELGTGDAFYLREEQDAGDGNERDLATNRLVYVRTLETDPEPDDGPLDRFVLVELLVPKDSPAVIERRVHPLQTAGGALTQKQVEGADGVTREAWVLDLSFLESQTPPENPDIIYDAGKNARVAFRVSHRTFQPASDPGRTRFPQLFDPGVFRVEVAVAVGSDGAEAFTTAWPQKDDWSTLREETTELKIPSVRQN